MWSYTQFYLTEDSIQERERGVDDDRVDRWRKTWSKKAVRGHWQILVDEPDLFVMYLKSYSNADVMLIAIKEGAT